MRLFQKCGISDSLDGTEDDMVYENSAESSAYELDDSFVRELLV